MAPQGRGRRDDRAGLPRRNLLGLLLVVHVADDVGHVLVALFLFLDEGGVVHPLVFQLDLLFGSLDRLPFGLLALGFGVGFLKRNEFGLGGLRRNHLFLL